MHLLCFTCRLSAYGSGNGSDSGSDSECVVPSQVDLRFSGLLANMSKGIAQHDQAHNQV